MTRRGLERGRVFLGVVVLVGGCAWPADASPLKIRDIRPLFQITETPAGPLALPTDVAVGPQGRIYVVDGGNHRVLAFDRAGRYLFSIGREGSAAGEFRGPVGIGVDGAGRVYVADSGNHRIQVFDASGRILHGFRVTSGGAAVRPVDVAVDGRGGRLYVSGSNNHKVMVFTPDGKPVREWGAKERAGASSGTPRRWPSPGRAGSTLSTS